MRINGFGGFDGRGRARRLAGGLLLLALLLLPFAAGPAEQPFAPSRGRNRVLVLLVNFSDTTPAYTPAQFQDLFFGTHESTFHDYYRQASSGQLDLVGDVVGWLQVGKSHDFYANNAYGQGGCNSTPANANANTLVAEALDLAEAAGVNFRLYDNPIDGATDGVVDSLIVVHQGRGGENINNPKNIWSYVDALSNGCALPRVYDGVIIDPFVIVPEVSYRGDRIIEAGPPAHEYGHRMGLIDTYDKDGSSAGLGVWDLMAGGVWGGDWVSANLPVLPNAYDRLALGWLNPVVVGGSTQGWFALPAAGRAPTVLKIPANRNAPEEFFLAEYRPQSGYDRNLPAGGVAVYHVDYRNLFENRDSNIGCGGLMPRVALEQADGRYGLELNLSSGDTSDLFPRPSGVAAAFHAATLPDSRNHDCRLSGFWLSDFIFAGDTAWVYARGDDFRAHSPEPWLLADPLEWVEIAGDGDRFLEPGEVFQPALTLENSGATAAGLAVSFESQSPFILIGSTEQFFPDLAPGASATEVGGPFMTVLSGVNPELPETLIAHLSYDGGAQDVTVTARLGAPEILYVDDDGGNPIERYLDPALDDYGYDHDRWDVSVSGPPAAVDLAGYPFVLWVTGNIQPPLSAAELAALSAYLDGGGTLILSSAFLLVQPTAEAQAFARNYLHLTAWTDDRFAIDRARGITGNPLSHLLWNNLTSFFFPEFNRTVGLTPDALALGSVYNDRNHYAAVVYPSSPDQPSVFRVVYYSYGLENMRPQDLGPALRRPFNVFNYRPGRPWAVKTDPERAQPRKVNLTVQMIGFGFSATNQFAFSGAGVTVGSFTLINSSVVNLVVHVAWDADPGWHDLIATTAAGNTVRVPHLFKVEGEPLPNHPPIAAAGPDQTVWRNRVVTLSASASADPDYDRLTYQWRQTAGPAVTLSPSDTAAVVTFNSGTAVGDCRFELTVSDPFVSAGDSVVVTVQNRPPAADAGADQAGWRADVFSLDGRSSSDPDGDTLTVHWVQTAGPAVAVLPSDTARLASFIPDPAWVGDYRFRLEVSDPWVTAADTVAIAVANRLPVANAGPDQRVLPATWVRLEGRGSYDPDRDAIIYQWSQDAGPPVTLQPSGNPRPRFWITVPGNYHFNLLCSDPFGVSPADGVTVIINIAPVAEAGPGSVGFRGQQMTLDGSLSSDPNGDPIAFAWEQLSGPPVSLSPGATAEMVGFTAAADYLGDYVFRLTVTDAALADSDTVIVTIRNRPPAARAGADQAGPRSQVFLLDGDSSFDPDGDPLGYQWTQLAGPAVALLPSDTVAAVYLTPAPDWVGRYVFQLQAQDPWDAAGDTVAVTMVNQPPSAGAGADVFAIRGDTVTLHGESSSDPDLDPLDYSWQQLAGPAVTLNLSDPARPTFSAAAAGNYLFELVVDDPFGLSDADTVAVVVRSIWNHLPTANAGPDQTLDWANFAPVQLDGTQSSDPDGDPLVYNWTMVSRPPLSSAVLSNPASPTPTFNDDYLGTYVVRLSVFDGEIWSRSDEITVLTTGNTIDSDLDGQPDCVDPDDDNDALPDAWETAHGLDPLSSADADPVALNPVTDPDGDGNANIHEYHNGSDPQAADRANCTPRIGGCFFGDANGDLYYGPPDVSAYTDMMKGRRNNFPLVYPHNGDNFDLNGDTYIGPPDLAAITAMIKGATLPTGMGPARAEMVAPGYALTAAAGSTVGLTLRVVSAGGQPRSGLAMVFELIKGTGTFLGGEGELPGDRTWSEPGTVNTAANESAFTLSRDELEMIVASDRTGGRGGFDLYVARRANTRVAFDNFTPIAETNTAGQETTPALSADRREIFFSRDVAGWDIYRATRNDVDSPWNTPQPVAELNTAGLEFAPTITDDGLTLYFVKYQAANPGAQLYRAHRLTTASPFGAPTAVTELNTAAVENMPTISGDDTRIYFLSNRATGNYDLWYAERANPSVPFSTPVALTYVNTGAVDLQAWESADRRRLYLSTYGYHATSDVNLYQIKRPTTDLPYWVSSRTARYDVTGVMAETAAQDSGGRVHMVFQPTGCGTFDIAAYGDEDILQKVPTFSAAGLIRVTVPCP